MSAPACWFRAHTMWTRYWGSRRRPLRTGQHHTLPWFSAVHVSRGQYRTGRYCRTVPRQPGATRRLLMTTQVTANRTHAHRRHRTNRPAHRTPIASACACTTYMHVVSSTTAETQTPRPVHVTTTDRGACVATTEALESSCEMRRPMRYTACPAADTWATPPHSRLQATHSRISSLSSPPPSIATSHRQQRTRWGIMPDGDESTCTAAALALRLTGGLRHGRDVHHSLSARASIRYQCPPPINNQQLMLHLTAPHSFGARHATSGTCRLPSALPSAAEFPRMWTAP